MSARRSTLALAAALLLGCEIERGLPPPEVDPSEVGAHFELYRERPERETCAGSTTYLDRFIERTFEALEEPLPTDFRIPLRLVDETPCGRSTCYSPVDETVYLESLNLGGEHPFEHLRHALALAAIHRAWGRSLPFFEQGLADSFSASHAWRVSPDDRASVLDSLAREEIMVDIAAAARFVWHLIDARGLDRFRQLYQSGARRTQVSARAAIRRVYGEDAERVVDEFTASPRFCRHRFDICDPQRAEPVGAAWSSAISVSCDDPNAHGVLGGAGKPFTTLRTLEVETSGRYRLRASEHVLTSPRGERRPRVLLESCGGCDGDLYRLYMQEHEDEVELELAAGLYSLEVWAWDGLEMTAELERLGDAP